MPEKICSKQLSVSVKKGVVTLMEGLILPYSGKLKVTFSNTVEKVNKMTSHVNYVALYLEYDIRLFIYLGWSMISEAWWSPEIIHLGLDFLGGLGRSMVGIPPCSTRNTQGVAIWSLVRRKSSSCHDLILWHGRPFDFGGGGAAINLSRGGDGGGA